MNLVLTGGGSAGHTVPHLALLPSLSRYFENIYYIGTNGIEKDIISKTNLKFYEIDCPKLIRKATIKNFLIPVKLSSSYLKSKSILKQLKPSVVFSKGGYVALPVVLAARSLKIPVIAHESDLSIGLANKISSKFCDSVFTSFYETSLKLSNGKYSGSPVREELFTAKRASAKKTYGFDNRKKTVLVLGGGSGSRAINTCLRNNLEKLTKNYNFVHICGRGNLCNIENSSYKEFEFVSDMQNAYAACDMVISRAGSNTVFEILLLRKPSILIPLPKDASRGDQIENALYFESRGLCKVLYQKDLNVDNLLALLKNLSNDNKLMSELKSGKIKSGNYTLVNAVVEAAANKNS